MTLNEVAKIVGGAKHVAIMGHIGGDNDCYGSAFGLKIGLESLGKKVDLISGEDFPANLEYLFFYFQGEIRSEIINGIDLLILLDSSDLKRLSAPEIAKDYKSRGVQTVLLDHHPMGDLVGFVDSFFTSTEACSTSEIVYNLLTAMDAQIDKNCATCLLAGIIGDTSSFQNQNTTKECFSVSSELMKKGARLRTIVNNTFGGKEVDLLKVWGLAMERLSVNEEYGIASTYLTHEEIQSFGLSNSVTTGIVNFLNSIKGVQIVMFITEEDRGTVKVSLRTRDEQVDVAKIARQLGGGGHVKAAAFSFPGSLKILTENGKNHIVIV